MLVLRTERKLADILDKVALSQRGTGSRNAVGRCFYHLRGAGDDAKQGMDEIVLRKMNMPVGEPPTWNHGRLSSRNEKMHARGAHQAGGHAELPDATNRSTNHFQAVIYNDRQLVLDVCHSEKITDENAVEVLGDADGIVIAPGFGQRGIEGKFVALRYARENDIPTFGICLGMQCMVIEYARSVLGLEGANSTEMDPMTPHKVIDLMEEQKHITNMGASMRLGAYDCLLKKGSLAHKAYGKSKIEERHRHRYEFNNAYKESYEAAGMKCSGINPDSDLVEVVEVPSLRWFMGTQYHPEYNSTVISPNPLFMSFMQAAAETRELKKK